MISEAKYKENYVGPKAIFDRDFIPPNILHRQKEEHSLFSMIKDSIKDDFRSKILFQGIEGIHVGAPPPPHRVGRGLQRALRRQRDRRRHGGLCLAHRGGPLP